MEVYAIDFPFFHWAIRRISAEFLMFRDFNQPLQFLFESGSLVLIARPLQQMRLQMKTLGYQT